MNFDVVPRTEAARVKQITRRNIRRRAVQLLLAGETIWIATDSRKLTSWWTTMDRLGYRLKVRSGQREGIDGTYLWAVKRSEE